MGAVATFSWTTFSTRYPEFATIGEPLATVYFAEACIYHRNDGTGPVKDVNVQLVLLNMLTAHIADRYATVNSVAPSPLVGRINNASEGSVSVATENSYPPGSVQWYQQTKYGADYWNATKSYRTAHYVPGVGRSFGSGLFGFRSFR